MKTENGQTTNSRARWTVVLALGIFVLLLLTVLVLLQSSQLWSYFQVESASETLALYALSSLNFFAFIIFAFIFLRSVVRLARERRAFKLGSRLKTRLLVYFVAVSLLPIAAMATFSYLFLNRALEKWFSSLPETVIAEARQVQKKALAERVAEFNEKARLFAAIVELNPELEEQNLRQSLERGNLSGMEISAPNGVVLARVMNESLDEQKQNLRQILTLPENAKEAQDGIGFDFAQIDLTDGRRLRVVSKWNDEASFSREISNSPFEFERLKEQQAEVRQLGFSVLSLLTLLLIFAASWVAFHLGRSLTQPIRALAEGSKEIERGNLAHRVEALAEDELALLIESFNQMAAGLEENQQKLEERRRYIETVLQSLSTGVVSLDTENRVTTINDAAVSILQLENKTGVDCFLSDLIAEENLAAIEKLLARARRLRQASEQTVLSRQYNSNGNGFTTDSSSLPVALTATALRENSGKNVGVVLVIEDLSELLAAQRAAAWQEVARRMAHEIKNPLTPIQLAAERIAKRFSNGDARKMRERRAKDAEINFSNSNGDEQRTKDKGQTSFVVLESTETILREVDGLKSMVNEFSHFARLPHARLENGDLNEILRQTAALYEDRLRDVRLEVDLADDLPSIKLDAEQLRRAFVNLIDNALEAFDAAQSEKKIAIRTRHDAGRDLLVAEISDNGRGIAAGDIGKLFQPYFSTKNRGTGLGLAIVQRIVTEHGGRIRAAANQLRGAKFIVELPIANG